MGEDHSEADRPPGHALPDEAADPWAADPEAADPEAADPEADGEPGTALPPRIEGWRRRSATGAMLTGFAFGLREAFEVKRDEPAIMLETSGVPPKELPVEADMDNVPPRQSVVRIRRWLLPDGTAAEDRPADDDITADDGAGDHLAGDHLAGDDAADPATAGRRATSIPARSRRPAPRPNAPRRASKRRR